MEERNGVRGVTADGIFFTEDAVPAAATLKHLEVEISRQNSNLAAVKAKLAADAKAAGGNALMNFRYGQRPHKGLRLLLPKWDTESWFGEGDAVQL
jgi:hypothetical protein